MTIKKTLASLVLVGAMTLGAEAKAVEWNKQVIDTGFDKTNPAMKIDSTGIQHLVWSKWDELIYANSSDNFVNKKVISNNMQIYAKPTMAIDSNNDVHIGFQAQQGSWSTYYVNSINWNVIGLGTVGYQDDISIGIDRNNKVYIASQDVYPSYDKDIIIASSTDYQNFNLQPIHKIFEQFNPSLAIDSNNNVGLVYWDWSDGVVDGVGQYKTRFRSSLDNFVSEQTVSTAPQSYGADIKIDSLNNVWISYKDTRYSEEGFDKGDVFLKNLTTEEEIRITPTSKNWWQDRPTSLAIDNLGNKHLGWSEADFENWVETIVYANSDNLYNLEIVDMTDNWDYFCEGGYVKLDTFNNLPNLSVNFGPLINYSQIPEPSIISLLVGAGLTGLGVYALSRRKRDKNLD